MLVTYRSEAAPGRLVFLILINVNTADSMYLAPGKHVLKEINRGVENYFPALGGARRQLGHLGCKEVGRGPHAGQNNDVSPW